MSPLTLWEELQGTARSGITAAHRNHGIVSDSRRAITVPNGPDFDFQNQKGFPTLPHVPLTPRRMLHRRALSGGATRYYNWQDFSKPIVRVLFLRD